MAATGGCAHSREAGAQPVYHAVLSAIPGVTIFFCFNEEK